MIIELEVDNEKYLEELQSRFQNVIEDIHDDMLTNPFSKYLICIIDEKIIGYLNYYYIYDRIEIANFNVLSEYQGNGYGKKLLEYLIDKYQEMVKNITLEVRDDNHKAINLYHKEGFVDVAMRKGYYHGKNGILMERSMKV